jgi:hypothetical protein
MTILPKRYKRRSHWLPERSGCMRKHGQEVNLMRPATLLDAAALPILVAQLRLTLP